MRILSLLAMMIGSAWTLGAEPALSVGFAEADITPKLGAKPVFMAGFGQDRKATKIHDPILIRVVVLSDGTRKLAMASVDVVGLFLPNVENIRAQVKGFDHVLVSSTHNHEGPDTLGLWGANPFKSGVDPEYLTSLETAVAKAILAADAARKPAKARIGTAKGPELLHDARQPIVLHDDLVAIRFDAPDAKPDDQPLGILVEWNVHPESLDSKNTEISADHVGYTVKYLKERFKCPLAYFTGTVGGLMTNLHVPIKGKDGQILKDGTFEKAEAYGVAVGKLGENALKAAVEAKLVPFQLKSQSVLVPVDNGMFKLAMTAGVLKRTMFDKSGKEMKELKDPSQTIYMKTEIGCLHLGELDIACIPGEIYPELVLGKVQDPVDPGADFPDAPIEPAIYKQLPGKHRMLIGLANDEIGYILPKRQWDEKPPYCYGLKKSQYGEINSCGPDVGPVLCKAFQELAKQK